MTLTEMEQAIRNLDVRTELVVQILPTLATKHDLEQSATKVDLERFATKEDLERFATKDDLGREISGLRSQLLTVIEGVQSDVRLLAEHLSSVLDWIREQRAKA